MKVGINGMGRIGRLVLRAAMGSAERQADDPRAGNRVEVVHLNELKGGAAATAHLLAFDSVQGKWQADIRAEGEDTIRIDGRRLSFSSHATAAEIPWGELGVDVVLECTGKFLTPETLKGHLDCGAKRVIVAAPVKTGGVLNIVVGINHEAYDPVRDRIVTAASCTTNCLAPTTTGSATAIALIYPELKGKLNGHAVRVPVLNASLTDGVFELQRATTAEEVNTLFEAAAQGSLTGTRRSRSPSSSCSMRRRACWRWCWRVSSPRCRR